MDKSLLFIKKGLWFLYTLSGVRHIAELAWIRKPNTPEGFREWALGNGAVEMTAVPGSTKHLGGLNDYIRIEHRTFQCARLNVN